MALVRGRYERHGGEQHDAHWTYHRHHYCCDDHTEREIRSSIGALVLMVVLLIVGPIVWLIVQLIETIVVLILGTLGVLAVSAVGYVLITLIQRRRAHAYLRLCRRFTSSHTLAPDELARLQRLWASVPAELPARVYGEEAVYHDFVAQMLGDGVVDDAERRTLAQLEAWFQFDEDHTQAIKLQALDDLIEAVVTAPTAAAEAHVREVATRLGLGGEPLAERLRQIRPPAEDGDDADEHGGDDVSDPAVQARAPARAARELAYRLAAEVHAQPRQPISPSVRLPKGETAWHEVSPVTLGERTGTLVVTNRRLLFVADGARTIKLGAILDVAADPEQDRLRVIVDGEAQALELRMAQPLVTMAHIERSLDELASTASLALG